MPNVKFIFFIFLTIFQTLLFSSQDNILKNLTNEERAYLLLNKNIKICVESRLPFEAISNNKYIGISADYFDLISQKTGINFQPIQTNSWLETLKKGKTRECDILPLAMETPERKVYMNFTKPYLVIPLVIATTLNKPFIADLPDVISKRLGLIKGYAYTKYLKTKYPNIEIVEFNTVYDGLIALEQNKIYGFIGDQKTISYEISHSFSTSIKISGRAEQNLKLGIAVRNDNPLLYSIVSKAVKSIEINQIKKIENKWASVVYEHKFNYSSLWKILIFISIVALIFFYRYWKTRKFNQKLQELNLRLKEREESFRYLVNNAYEGIAVVQNKRLVFVNPRMSEMTGYTHDVLLNLENFLPLIAPEARETMMDNHLNRLAGKGSPIRYESLFLKKDGTIYPIELTGVLISWNNYPATLNIVSDISERKAAEESIRFMALHDNLTRLPNRYLLMERLEQSLAQARRSKQLLGICFIDLNGFKLVNDTYGHNIGDKLLQGVANRLQKLMRTSDTLARMGGDEFVILLPQINGQIGVEALIARIEEALESPFQFDSLELKSQVSIGYALFPENGETAKELLMVADQKMYHDKQNKKKQ